MVKQHGALEILGANITVAADAERLVE